MAALQASPTPVAGDGHPRAASSGTTHTHGAGLHANRTPTHTKQTKAPSLAVTKTDVPS